MASSHTIRTTQTAEHAQILALYPEAFPDEDLTAVVTRLLEGSADVLSLATFDGDGLIAHVLFTLIAGEDEPARPAGALLAPLGVLPGHQGQGVGSALVKAGLQRLETMGVAQVFVLGDPNYYGRFGFAAEQSVSPPYPLPAEWTGAWQSLTLADRAPMTPGPCRLPEAWMDPALWQP